MLIDKNIVLPKVVIFDWDLTLADNSDLIRIAYEQSALALGIDLMDKPKNHLLFGLSTIDNLKAMLGDQWESWIRLFKVNYERRIFDNLKLMDGANEILQELKQRGTYMVLASNKMEDLLLKEVNYLGLDKYFDKIIGAVLGRPLKPEIELFQRAIKAAPMLKNNKEVWVVGDQPLDVQLAENGGAVSIFVNEVTDHMPSDIKPDYSFSNLAQLNKMIRILFDTIGL